MLDGKYDEAWGNCEYAQREKALLWTDGSVEADRVRDRVRRWWHARNSRGTSSASSEGGELERELQCAECGDRFLAPLGTVRCVSCSDQEW
jgi:hypothetical protein